MKQYQLSEEEKEKGTWLFQEVWKSLQSAICLISEILMEVSAISDSNKNMPFISYQTFRYFQLNSWRYLKALICIALITSDTKHF